MALNDKRSKKGEPQFGSRAEVLAAQLAAQQERTLQEARRQKMMAAPSRGQSDPMSLGALPEERRKDPESDAQRLAAMMAAPSRGMSDPMAYGRPMPDTPDTLAPVADAYGMGGGSDPMADFEAMLAAMPAIDKAQYVAPYDEAMERARGTHAEAVPFIQGVYGDLRGKLEAGLGDQAGRSSEIRDRLMRDLAQRQQALSGAQAPLLGDLQAQAGGSVDPGLMARLEGDLGAQRTSLLASGDDQRALVDRLAEVAAQSGTARLEDTRASEGAALANSSANLENILGQLGIKRAAAERDYGEDVASREQQVAQLRQQFLDQQAARAAEMAKAAQEAAKAAQEEAKVRQDEEKRYFETYARSPRQRLEEQAESLIQRNPVTWDALRNITGGVKGDGSIGRAEALRVLRDAEPELRADGVDVGTLENWIRAWYDSEKKLDSTARGQASRDRRLA